MLRQLQSRPASVPEPGYPLPPRSGPRYGAALADAGEAGQPFFLEETVRTLVETGALAGEQGAYRLTRLVEALQMPVTVQTILAARIDQLPAEEKQLLQNTVGYCRQAQSERIRERGG